MFSKACKYGIRAVLYLAAHTSDSKKMGVDEVAESLQVPRHFLAKILQQLAKAGLISSSKGPNGGFYLSRENRKGNLHDVAVTIDGEDLFSSCILGLPVCSSANPCPLHTQAYIYREGLAYQFEKLSIQDLVETIKMKDLDI